MNTRNAIRNRDGSIDMEIEHPEFGWIPFTASPTDSEEHGRALYAEADARGDVPAPKWPEMPDISAEPTTAEIVMAIAKRDAGDKSAWEAILKRLAERDSALAEQAKCADECATIRAAHSRGEIRTSAVSITREESK